ncbi:class I SAM-dependent methyltransferase [Streptomyces sp. NPDC016845]|uniref:class I SAM-dependent methyltransferase n=1 Tax=Streptomyces sp. NPDC016845 TaxID=3364972 RepID=UPI0037AD815D
MAHGHHQHGHTQEKGAHHTHPDWVDMLPQLERNAEVYTPLYTQALDWLRVSRPAGTRLIVDAGSGPGAVARQLAAAFPEARVVAADPEEALLARAAERAEEAGLSDRLSTLRVELPDQSAQLPTADLIWAARSLHHVGDQRAAIAALADRLAPGGTLALVEGGLPWRCLPRDFGLGRPGLQARADALEEQWFAEMRAELPGAKEDTEDWAALLTDAGLTGATSRTFLLDLPAPLDDDARAFVIELWKRRADTFPGSMAADDAEVLARLVDPDDPRSLYRRDDVFLLAAHTVHMAVRA